MFIGFEDSDRDDVTGKFKEIIASIVVLDTPLSTTSLSRLLGIPKRDIDTRLDLLHSVLNIPSDTNAPVKLLHLSFRDFLVDPKKRDKNPILG